MKDSRNGVKRMNELMKIYKRNFPTNVREESYVDKLLNNKNNRIIKKRNECNQLIAVSVINENTILMLCVDKEYRNKGIGSQLLKESEIYITNKGYDIMNIGVGNGYITPGVPTSHKYVESENENLYKEITDDARIFFEKRDYFHDEDCNIFDMRLNLKEFNKTEYNIGDTINGITYRWATIKDLDEIIKCVDDAFEKFTKYYKNENLYKKNNKEKVLIALKDNEVVGTLIVCIETEGKNIGSVGCTTVKHSYRGNHIGVNIVMIGTKYLKDTGLKYACLGYTYTGLDHMYGYSGYKITCYYMMATKKLKR